MSAENIHPFYHPQIYVMGSSVDGSWIEKSWIPDWNNWEEELYKAKQLAREVAFRARSNSPNWFCSTVVSYRDQEYARYYGHIETD